MYKFCCYLLFSLIGFVVHAQTLKQPVTLIDPASFTLMAGLINLAITPVTKPAVPLSSTVPCSCALAYRKLPAPIITLQGKRTTNENALLHWETTNELETSGFDVERSLGDSTNFNYGGFVTAQINTKSKKKYDLNDNNNFDGISYYRLKQIGLDSTITYSNIVSVQGYLLNASLKIYPNPAVSNIKIAVYFPKSGNAKMWILDAAQKIVVSKNINYNKGDNFINMPVTSLTAGFYFIKIVNNENILLNGNFIKQ